MQTTWQDGQLMCHLFMLQGYSYVPPFNDEALMEAVYSRGTIAISLDASQPSFRFYASGGRLCYLCAQQGGRSIACLVCLLLQEAQPPPPPRMTIQEVNG